jgi:hypothetical protein
MVQPPYGSPTGHIHDKPRRSHVLARRYGWRIASAGFAVALLMVLGAVLSSNSVMTSHALTINQKFGFYFFVSLIGIYVVASSLICWGVSGGSKPRPALVNIAVLTILVTIAIIIGFGTLHAVVEVIATHH